ncbi:hypothetical protein Mpal_2370 [Methanosphaerula palustris E1-9c]|uniref:Uncharacterized protein n=1 Tax=Methanosphaerula palustris (strain ATCC BAA-1556 / DSM 19958 / E1-9c) TaxID=521011 RepID=B8GEF0_METPE|nr:hypothetical protein Mpal_2370 [Methanosphaerula palustris E1-9c]
MFISNLIEFDRSRVVGKIHLILSREKVSDMTVMVIKESPKIGGGC